MYVISLELLDMSEDIDEIFHFPFLSCSFSEIGSPPLIRAFNIAFQK